jgi:hypothetical protein
MYKTSLCIEKAVRGRSDKLCVETRELVDPARVGLKSYRLLVNILNFRYYYLNTYLIHYCTTQCSQGRCSSWMCAQRAAVAGAQEQHHAWSAPAV